VGERSWSERTENILRECGWREGRNEAAKVREWKAKLALSWDREMPSAAEKVLCEFGGIRFSRSGCGRDCSLRPFSVDPTLANYDDWHYREFDRLAGSSLFPVGVASGGGSDLVVSAEGRVFLVIMNAEVLPIGRDFYEATESMVEGINPYSSLGSPW
jgi:hypothetical protein